MLLPFLLVLCCVCIDLALSIAVNRFFLPRRRIYVKSAEVSDWVYVASVLACDSNSVACTMRVVPDAY